MRFAARVACAAVVVCLALAPGALAQTGLCISDPGGPALWEINVATCGSTALNCLLQLSNVDGVSYPTPSAGALSWNSLAETVDITWQMTTTGVTPSTVSYACSIHPTEGLPWTGNGVVFIHHGLIGGGVDETWERDEGTCILDSCSSLTPP